MQQKSFLVTLRKAIIISVLIFGIPTLCSANNLTQLSKEVNNLSSKVDAMETKIDVLQNKTLTELTEQLTGKYEEIDGRINKLNGLLFSIEEKISKIDNHDDLIVNKESCKKVVECIKNTCTKSVMKDLVSKKNKGLQEKIKQNINTCIRCRVAWQKYCSKLNNK